MRILLLLLISISSFGQYTSNGITIQSKTTSSGIQYAEYGEIGWPLVVYLHGIGEVGKTPSALLYQSPLCVGWNNVTFKTEGFFYPDFFTNNIRVVAPVLKSGFWEPDYINKFLDEINTDNLVCLMGWSWGGGGVAKYINHPIKKYNFKCAIAMSMGYPNRVDNSSIYSGTNVTCPVKIVHAANDEATPVSNSDKFYAGIPEQFKAGYLRPDYGGHYVWQNFLQPSTGIYEWIKSHAQPISPPAEVEGKIVKIGNEVFAIFGNEKIKLN